MNKARLFLLVLPLMACAFYMRSLALWRPKKIYAGAGPIAHLVFSGDGKRLVIAQTLASSTRLLALDATRDFTLQWASTQEGIGGAPQFFSSDTRLLVTSSPIQALSSDTGQKLQEYGRWIQASVSPAGDWLASNGNFQGQDILPNTQLFITPIGSHARPSVTPQLVSERDGIVQSFAFSPDGRAFAVAVSGNGGTHLDVYEVRTWKRVHHWRDLNTRAVEGDVQWSRNGRFLLSKWSLPQWGQRARATSLSLWRVSDGRKLGVSRPQNTLVAPFFEVQNDGRVLLFDERGRVFLSRPSSLDFPARPLLNLSGESITAVTMSSDDTYLLVGTQSGCVYRQRLM